MPNFDQAYGSGGISTSLSASAVGTTVSTDAAANTKGSWTTLKSALGFNAGLLYIRPHGVAGVDDFLFDIGCYKTSNIALIQNVPLKMVDTQRKSISHLSAVPMFVKSGYDIIARCQSAGGGNSINFSVQAAPICNGLPFPYQNSVTYGSDTSTSLPTAVDPGGTAGADGAWVTLATLTAPLRCFYLYTHLYSGTIANCEWSISLGLGSGPTEVWSDFAGVTGRLSVSVLPIYHGPYFVNWPTGTIIKVKCSCTINTLGSRILGMALIGLG